MGDGSSVASANSPRSVPSSGVPIRRFHRLKDAAGLRMRPCVLQASPCSIHVNTYSSTTVNGFTQRLRRILGANSLTTHTTMTCQMHSPVLASEMLSSQQFFTVFILEIAPNDN